MRNVVTIDLRGLMEKRLAQPSKAMSGNKLIVTNDQEWYIWQLRGHCTQKQLADDLGFGKDKVAEVLHRLEKQGGPQGKRPEWMK